MPEVFVYAVEGRSAEQKKGLMKDITDAVVKNFGAKAEAVTVQIVESSRKMFLEGTWDALGQLLERPDLIRATAEGLPYLNSFTTAQ